MLCECLWYLFHVTATRSSIVRVSKCSDKTIQRFGVSWREGSGHRKLSASLTWVLIESEVLRKLLGGSSQLVSGLVHPSYKWTLPPLIPFITNVITHLLSGMNHQVGLLNSHDQNYQNCWFRWNLRTHALKLTTWMQFSLPLSILTPSSLRGAKVWALESWVATRWCPPSYKLVYNPNNYRYNPHKP